MTDTEERSNKRLKTTGEAPEAAPAAVSSADLPTIPVFSNADLVLNEDTMEEIVDFVNGDGASYCAFTAVSKDFHAALIPRQKKVWYGGFKTFEDFLAKGFVGMEFFSGRNSLWIGGKVLSRLRTAIAFQNCKLSTLQAVAPEGLSAMTLLSLSSA